MAAAESPNLFYTALDAAQFAYVLVADFPMSPRSSVVVKSSEPKGLQHCLIGRAAV